MRHRAMLIVTAAVLASGCARTTIDHSIPTDYPRTDDTAALDFWHNLSQRAAITNDEGLHGVLVLMAGNDPTNSYESRLDLLREGVETQLPREVETGEVARFRRREAEAHQRDQVLRAARDRRTIEPRQPVPRRSQPRERESQHRRHRDDPQRGLDQGMAVARETDEIGQGRERHGPPRIRGADATRK